MKIDVAKLVVGVALALPAGWFAAVLVDRVPDLDPFWKPFPRFRVRGKYLTIHVLMVGLFAAGAIRFSADSWWVLGPYLGFFCVLLALSVIDFEVLRLPDHIVVPALLASIAAICTASVVLGDAAAIRRALIGSATYFGFLFIFHLIFGNRGMGFGDVKLASVLGLYLGWIPVDELQAVVYVLWAMIVGVLGGAIVGIVLFIFRGRSRSYPFGPFLAMGTIILVLFGRALVPG